MKEKFYIFSLILVVSLTSLRMWGPWLSYQANRDFIIQELCMNRFSPQKGCNGKCHLKKTATSTSNNTDHSGETELLLTLSPMILDCDMCNVEVHIAGLRVWKLYDQRLPYIKEPDSPLSPPPWKLV